MRIKKFSELKEEMATLGNTLGMGPVNPAQVSSGHSLGHLRGLEGSGDKFDNAIPKKRKEKIDIYNIEDTDEEDDVKKLKKRQLKKDLETKDKEDLRRVKNFSQFTKNRE